MADPFFPPVQGDVQAALDAASQPVIASLIPDHLTKVLLPRGWNIADVDLSDYTTGPARSKGETVVHSAASFHDAICRFLPAGAPVNVYANQSDLQLVAVLNDYGPYPSPTEPFDPSRVIYDCGHRDWTVRLGFERTVEWQRWLDYAGFTTLERLAEVFTDGYRDILSPDPADMLEVAQAFEVAVDVKVAAGTRVHSGARTLEYAESTAATAGKGQVEVPEQFQLTLIPFVGGTVATSVVCDLRYKVREGRLQIGYFIRDAHLVEDFGFSDAVDSVNRLFKSGAESKPNVLFLDGEKPRPV